MESKSDDRVRRSFILPLMEGIAQSASTLFVIYLAPWIFALFFQQGLKGTTFWMVLLLIPCLLFLIPLFRIPNRSRRKFKVVSGWILAPLLCLFGLVTQFEFNKESLLTMGLLDAIILLGVFNSQLDFSDILLHPVSDSKKNKSLFKTNIQIITGFSIPILVITHILNITATISILFFGAAILFAIRSLWLSSTVDEELLNGENLSISNNLSNPEKKPDIKVDMPKRLFRPDLWFIFFSKWLLFAVQMIITLYITSEQALPLWEPWLLGIVIGVLIFFGFPTKFSNWAGIVSLAGLFIESMIIGVDWELLATPSSLFFMGIVLGLTWGWIFEDFSVKRAQHIPWNHKFFQAFWIVAFSVGIGAATHQMKFLIRDYSSYLSSALPIFVVVLVLILLSLLLIGYSFNLRLRANARIQQYLELVKSKVTIPAFRSIQKKSVAITLMIGIITSTFCGVLQMFSRAGVYITLDRTYYDVDGNPVTSLFLKERTGKILLYSPFPTGIIGNETIRPAKTIRIGAYLYDARAIGNFTNSQARDWIAQTMDVYSLGGYTNYTFWPEDIQAMRNINNNTRFYIMNFATTLGEYDNWTVDTPLGDATSVWNDTMDEWTLKDLDGTESIGVRRGSDDSKGHLMDLGSEGWANYYAWVWNNRVEAYHADGVAIDEVMWRGYWGTEVSQLRDYSTIAEITATCYDWLECVDNKFNYEIITQAFWDDAQVHQDGIWGELAFRGGGAYGIRVDDRTSVIFYEAMNWTGIVENLISHGERGRSYIWAAWYNRYDTEALEYCVSTYLMGKVNNCTSVTFHPQPTYDGGYPVNLAGYSLDTVRRELARNNQYFDLEMGNALSPMQLKSGFGGQYFERGFTNGIVLVNPFHGYVPGFDYIPPENPSH